MIGFFLVFLNFVFCQFQHAIEFKYTKAENKKEQVSVVHLPVTWPGKATERLCVTDPKKRFLGKTDMVVDYLLRDPPKPERKASLTPGKAVSGFNFPIKRRMNWEMKNMLSLDF